MTKAFSIRASRSREAVYFEPHLLEWLRDLAEREKVTVSVVVNRLVEKAKEARA